MSDEKENTGKISTSELIIRADGGEKAHIRNLPASVMQALYHELTGRTETLKKTFRDDHIITFQEIEQVCNKLNQFIEQYDVKGADFSFDVSFFGGTRQRLSSLERFMLFDVSAAEKISEIDIRFAFLLATPQVGVYQNYKVIINLRSYALHKDFTNLRFGHSRYSDETGSITIEYIDYVVAKSLMSHLSDWIDGCDKFDVKRRILNFLGGEYEEQSGYIFSAIAMTSVLSTIYAFQLFLGIDKLDDIKYLLFTIYYTASFSILVFVVAYSAFYIFMRKASFGGVFPYIIITRGDQRNYDTFIAKNRERDEKYYRIMYGVVIALIVNLTSSVIFAYYTAK